MFKILAPLVCWTLGGVLRFFVGALPWGLDRMPRFLGFLLMGELLARFDAVGTTASTGVKRAILFFLSLGFSLLAWNFPDLSWAYCDWTGYWAEIGMAVLGSGLTFLLAQRVDCRLWATLGAVSLGLMLIHKFPLMALQLAFGRWLSATTSGFLLAGLAIAATVAVTAFSYLAVRVLRRWAPGLPC